ncbi:MAG: response regulator [Anaerolineae bacterium]|nr:response regulator [Anaerolineae bacterium]
MQFDFAAQPLRIVLVDDDEDDYLILRDIITNISEFAVEIDWASTHETALAVLTRNEHDICLLDYFMGKYTGLDILKAARAKGCQVPFIMLTGSGNRSVDLQAMKSGVEFYLDKNHLNPFDLERAIRYSIERAHILRALQDLNSQLEERVADRTQQLLQTNLQLENEIEVRKKIEEEVRHLRHERERATLSQIAQYPKTSLTAKMLGMRTLRESEPDTFKTFVDRYDTLLELAMEQIAYRVEHHISTQLRELAEAMGTMRLSPRDLVEIHQTVLNTKNVNITPEKADTYVEEGRLMIFELMGHLSSYYRNFAFNVSNRQGRLKGSDPTTDFLGEDT